MKILSPTYEYPPVGGGGGAACRALSEAMVRAGHEMHVVTSRMRGLAAEEVVAGVRLHRVFSLRRYRHYATIPELMTHMVPAYHRSLRLIADQRPDVMHAHFVLPSGVVTYLLAKRTGLPYVLTAHGSDVPRYNPDRFHRAHRWLAPLWRRVILDARGITAPSRFLRSLIRARIDVPVEVIPYGFDAPSFAEVPRQNRVLVATRLFARKGVQHVIRAWSQLETDWELCIAGDGPYLPRLRRLAEASPGRIAFTGFLSRDDLQQLYRTSRVFVLTSTHENFPVVLLEAMAAGCAVVTSSAPGCLEVTGDAAIAVEPERVDALREALQSLLPNDTEIARLAALSRQRVTRFSWSRIGERYEAMIRRCLNVARAPAELAPTRD